MNVNVLGGVMLPFFGTSLGAAEEKTEISETSAGGHRYQRHVSDSLQ